MSKLNYKVVGVVLLLSLAILLSGCSQNVQKQAQPTAQPTTTPGENVNYEKAVNLSKAEKDGILYMREEEKLARDVYQTLYNKWELQIFANIAKSEQTHMEAVKLLVDKYGLEDPVKDKVGEFTNPKLQDLYNKLIEDGSKSVEDALKVGAVIEEIDIIDLQKHLAETNKGDIKLVYENLMKGSRNHLRAFTSNLAKYGITYEPQYLSKEEYEKIVSSPMEKGAV